MKRAAVTAVVLAVSMFSAFAKAVEQKYSPIPPAFSSASVPEETLRKYPLGVITKQAAFSHHGQATRTIALPNGNEGWVYQIGEGRGLRTYTLVFDAKGVVTDVLYNERNWRNGFTALQLQAQAGGMLGPDVEPQPYKKHPPEVFQRK